MADDNTRLQYESDAIDAVQGKGLFAKIGTYTKLSGPGWLQSAITLGGGSLAGSLYLGSVGGYEMMWLQPLMMIFGIVMLSAVGYVALSTSKSPFQQINEHISPVLGWGWAIATLMANLVWAMPQFSLGTAAMQQNLGIIPETDTGQWIGIGILFFIGVVVIWSYDSGAKGVKMFEMLLKILVGIIVLSFVAVVVTMSAKGNGLPWSDIMSGFVPDPNLLTEPASSVAEIVNRSSNPEYWKATVVRAQQDRMVAAAATAVGINMTFLLPFSMLKRGWGKKFRGLAKFDLSTGLFIPFVLATSCVVIAAASQFHGKVDEGLLKVAKRTPATLKVEGAFKKNLDAVLKKNIDAQAFLTLTTAQEEHEKKITARKEELIKAKGGDEAAKKEVAKGQLTDPFLGLGYGPLDAERNKLPEEDKVLAATLIKRDAFALANSLEHLAGPGIAQIVFGIGVLGMAISTIIILMLINGFTICEMLGRPSKGWLHRIGCILPGITGALGFVYLWGNKAIPEAKFYLAVPTSRFGMVLLPIAYLAFFFLMNSRKVLGDELPKGIKRLTWNVLMLIGLALAVIGAGMSIKNETGKVPGTDIHVQDIALGVLGCLIVLGIVLKVMRAGKQKAE